MTDAPARDADNLAISRQPDGRWGAEASPRVTPGVDEVQFQILRAALCGTDRQILRGERPDSAPILGHEAVAQVAALGARAAASTTLRLGDRVVFNPVNATQQDEILGHSTPGVFQRFLTLPLAEVQRRGLVIPVKDTPLDLSVLAEPLGTVCYTHEILERYHEQPVRSVLILGAGSMGVLHGRFAHALGVQEIRIVCKTERRAAWLHAKDIIPGARFQSPEAANLRSAQVDLAVFCAPARATVPLLDLAAQQLESRGALALVGGVDRTEHPAFPGVDLIAARRNLICGLAPPNPIAKTTGPDASRRLVFGHRGTAARHLDQALTALKDDPGFGAVLTHRTALSTLPNIFSAVQASSAPNGQEYLKALIDCTIPPSKSDS